MASKSSAIFRGNMNLRARIERASTRYGKYNVPVAGKNLWERDRFNFGIDARLPDHYKQFYAEWKKGPSQKLHFPFKDEIFEKDQYGLVRRVQNVGGNVMYPMEFHEGLWGGEGMIKGFLAPAKTKHWPNFDPEKPKYWFPKLHQAVVHSEVLNRYSYVL